MPDIRIIDMHNKNVIDRDTRIDKDVVLKAHVFQMFDLNLCGALYLDKVITLFRFPQNINRAEQAIRQKARLSDAFRSLFHQTRRFLCHSRVIC